MIEAPGPIELATTQLLPYLAVGGNEEAWRVFVVTRTYLQGQEVREVARELGLTLSGVYKARDRVRRLLEEEGQAESLPSVGNGALP